MREPFDARHDADFDEYTLQVLAKMYAAPFDKRLLARGFITGLVLPVGGVLSVMPLLSTAEGERWGAVGLGIGGGVLFVACLIQFGKVAGRSLAATQRWRRYKKDYRQWSAERPVGSVWASSDGRHDSD